MLREQGHGVDPIDRGLEHMRGAIRPDPARQIELGAAKSHLADLKAIRGNIDSFVSGEARSKASALALDSGTETITQLENEKNEINAKIDDLNNQLRELGKELEKYISLDDAVAYISGIKQPSATTAIRKLFSTRPEDGLLKQMQGIHLEVQKLKGEKEKLTQQIGREHTKIAVAK